MRNFAFLRHQPAELFDALCAQDIFQSRQQLVLAVPRFRENAQDRLDRGKEFFFWQKISEDRGFRGQASQPAANKDLESAARSPVIAADLRDEADVVDARHRAGAIIFATRKRDLELARQIVKIRMPQKIS